MCVSWDEFITAAVFFSYHQTCQEARWMIMMTFNGRCVCAEERVEIKRIFLSFSSRLFALEQLLTNCWVAPIVIITDDVFITMRSASLWQKPFDWRNMVIFGRVKIEIGTSWQWKRERIEWVALCEVKVDSHFEFIRSLWTWRILASCAWSEWDLNQHE